MSDEFLDKLFILEFHISEMSELILCNFVGRTDLLRAQSAVLQSLRDVRDTLIQEPKKD